MINRVEISLIAGSELEKVINKAKEISKLAGAIVYFRFNGIPLFADEFSIVNEILDKYTKLCRERVKTLREQYGFEEITDEAALDSDKYLR